MNDSIEEGRIAALPFVGLLGSIILQSVCLGKKGASDWHCYGLIQKSQWLHLVCLQGWSVGEDLQDSVDWRRGDDLNDGLPDIIGQVIEPIQAEEGRAEFTPSS